MSEKFFGKHKLGSVTRGGAWALAQNVSRGAIQLLSVILLSRLIEPEYFGVFAVMLVFHTLITSLIGRAFSTSIIQKDDLQEGEASNFLWVAVAVSGTIACAFILLGPIVAHIFDDPVYAKLAIAFGGLIWLDSFGAQYQALAMRSLRFDLLFKMQIIASPIALCVGVSAALAGWGVWALVAHMATASFLSRMLLIWFIGWLPRWFNRSAGVRGMVSFGARASLGAISRHLYDRLPILFLSYTVGPSAAGFFNRGDALFRQPFSQFVHPISSLLLPSMSAASSDSARLQSLASQNIWLIILVTGPLIAFLAVTGDWFAVVLLGPKWFIAGEVVRWMAVMSLGVAFRRTLASLNAAVGRPARSFWLKLGLLPFFLLILIWAAPNGAAFVATVMAGFYLAILPAEVFVLLRGLKLRIRPILISLASGLTVMLANISFIWLIRIYSPLTIDLISPSSYALLVLMLYFCSSYAIGFALSALFPEVRKILFELKDRATAFLRNKTVSKSVASKQSVVSDGNHE